MTRRCFKCGNTSFQYIIIAARGNRSHKTDKKFSTKVLLTAKDAVRGLSDIRSDLKGYASLVLEYELEKIAAATARATGCWRRSAESPRRHIGAVPGS